MLGTNDAKPQNWQHKADFAGNMKALVDHFLAQPAKPRVLICTPLPVYQDHDGVSNKTIQDEVIPLIFQAAQQNRTPLVDMHKVMSGIPFLFPDGIHPNISGAELMARSLQAALATR